jgi:hypothetical protein
MVYGLIPSLNCVHTVSNNMGVLTKYILSCFQYLPVERLRIILLEYRNGITDDTVYLFRCHFHDLSLQIDYNE